MKGKTFAAVLAACLTVLAAVPAFGEEHGGAEAAEAPRTEAEWIAVLEAGGDWHEMQTACRALRQIGTEASVPALAALLGDAELSGLARFALEPMPYPEAGAALRAALDTTEGPLLAGVVTSLGVRRDKEAVEAIAALLTSEDGDVAAAAAGALGRIGTVESSEALLAGSGDAAGAVRLAAGEGLLAACEGLRERGDTRQAERIYEQLLDGAWPAHIQTGAFHGICTLRPRQAPARLIRALAGPDPDFRDMAAQIIGDGSGARDTRRFANALKDLPRDGQAALVRGLTVRRDPVARPSVLALLDSGDAELRVAAVTALGALGNVEDVPALVGLLDAEDGNLATAARAGLRDLKNGDVNAAVIAAMEDAPAPVRAVLVELVTERLAPESVAVAVAALGDPAAEVRLAAMGILRISGGHGEAPALLDALDRAEDTAERDAANRAIGVIAGREGEAVLPLLQEDLASASLPARVALLRNLAQVGNAEALETLAAQTESEEPEVAEEAVRVLGGWPNQLAAPLLLALARSDEERSRDTGLRGYIRLARDNWDIEARTEMLHAATAIVGRKEEAWLVLGAWGTVPTREALETVLPYLGDDETANEAGAAVISIAEALAAADEEHRPAAREALAAVRASAAGDRIQERAANLLETLTP